MYVKGKKLNSAIRVLIECLAEGEKLSNEMFRIAEECGISGRTLERAKRIIGVESKRGKNNERIWVMSDTARVKYPPDQKAPPELPIIDRTSLAGSDITEEGGISDYIEEKKRLNVSKLRRIFLICKPSAFQGKYDSFAGRIPRALKNGIMKGDAFVFCDRAKLQISILQWQGDGYALFFKRAEYGGYEWPVNKEVTAIEITSDDLKILLEYPRLMLRLSGVSTPYAVI
jgi:transposase